MHRVAWLPNGRFPVNAVKAWSSHAKIQTTDYQSTPYSNFGPNESRRVKPLFGASQGTIDAKSTKDWRTPRRYRDIKQRRNAARFCTAAVHNSSIVSFQLVLDGGVGSPKHGRQSLVKPWPTIKKPHFVAVRLTSAQINRDKPGYGKQIFSHNHQAAALKIIARVPSRAPIETSASFGTWRAATGQIG
ncbi:MAG TPA: hypothetical protein VG754_12165 [Verrucomicrobiae bacterium]|nr:hypothetical protein [Verrucomicrobiae bacterium]